MDALQTDCDSLKRLSIILTERIKHRLDGLRKHRELQEHIDTVCGVKILVQLRDYF